MKDMEKREYKGLVTTRMTVESPDIMATSNSKIKVKTVKTGTKEWVEEDVGTPLPTTISSEL